MQPRTAAGVLVRAAAAELSSTGTAGEVCRGDPVREYRLRLSGEAAQTALSGGRARGCPPPCVFVFSCFGPADTLVFSCFRVLGSMAGARLCFRVGAALRSLAAAVCQAAVGTLSDHCPTTCRTPLSLSLTTASFLHGAHHLAVLLVEGVGHAGVLLEVNLGDQLDIQRPGAWCRENSYCKIGNKDEGMAKKSKRPIL